MAGDAQDGHRLVDVAGAPGGVGRLHVGAAEQVQQAVGVAGGAEAGHHVGDGGVAVAQRRVVVVGAAGHLDRRRHQIGVQRRELAVTVHPPQLGAGDVRSRALEQVVVDLHHDPRAGLEAYAVAVADLGLVAAGRPRGQPRGVVGVGEVAGQAGAAEAGPALSLGLRRPCARPRRSGRARAGRGSRGARRPGCREARCCRSATRPCPDPGRAGSSGSRRCPCRSAPTACTSAGMVSVIRCSPARSGISLPGLTRESCLACTSGGSGGFSSWAGEPDRRSSSCWTQPASGRITRTAAATAARRLTVRVIRAASSAGARPAGAGGCGTRTARRPHRC